MGTFFVRAVLATLLLAGCSRGKTTPTSGLPAPRADTVQIALPVFRVTPSDSAGAVAVDSATWALIERRVMSRVSSIVRAYAERAAGRPTDGIPPVKDAAPKIRHGLLATITFNDDGSMSDSGQQRIRAVAKLLEEIEQPLEIRAHALSGTTNLDIAIARARRVYLDLIATNRQLEQRDVAFTITGVNSLHPIEPSVEILWRETPQE
jgi:hypothetical protein